MINIFYTSAQFINPNGSYTQKIRRLTPGRVAMKELENVKMYYWNLRPG